MRRLLVLLLSLGFVSTAAAQDLEKGRMQRRELQKVEATKRVETETRCEYNTDCPQGEVCDQLKKFCVRKAMSLVEFETASLTREVEEAQARMSVLRKGNIAKMEQLLAAQPYYENKAEIYFRLAEAYWEETHHQYLSARKEWMAALEKFDEGTVTARPEEPVEDYRQSLDYYRKILREFPDYQRLDEVLYYLGRGALEAGRATKDVQLQREGVGHFTNLTQNYAKSRLIPQALLHLGEYYFETNSLYYAKVNYEKIISNYPAATMYNYALYKLGWVYYNLAEFDKSIEKFHQVVDAIKGESVKGVVEFREQALSDLVLAYVEIPDGWRIAKEYYTKEVGEDGAYMRLHTMGELYIAQGKDDDAWDLYYHFIGKWPNGARIPEYYQNIVDLANKKANWKVIEEVVREIMVYFKRNGPWMTANLDQNPESAETALKMLEELVFYVANHYHVEGDKLDQKGDKRGSEALFSKAAEYYDEYLKIFPDSPRSYEINFWYAEILYFNLKDYENAAVQYNFVIDKDKKGKFVEDAALGVIYCYEELMVREGLRQRAAKKGGVQFKQVSAEQMRDQAEEIVKTDLHPLEQGFIRAADKYTELLLEARKDPEFVKANPKRGEMIPNIMYIAAETFYRHGMFQESVLRFENIFKYDPKDRFAAVAATMIMDSYYRVRNWEKVEEWARKLIRERNFLFKTQADLELIIATAITMKAKDYETEGKTTASLGELKRLTEEFRNNKEIMAYTTYTMAYLFAKSKKLREAIEKYEELIRKWPKSPKAAEAQFVIGEIYEAQTQFKRAADAFMEMSKFKEYPQASIAIINAATIYESLQDYEATIGALNTFLRLWPKHDSAPRAFLKIADLHRQQGKLDSAYKQYADFVKKYPSNGVMIVEAHAKAGEVLHDQDRTKNRKRVLDHMDRAVKGFKKLSEDGQRSAGNNAAMAQFYVAQYSYYDFSEFKVDTSNFYRLGNTLEAKAKMHQDAEALYDSVIAIKSRFWAAASYYQIGLLYHEFAQTLYAVPLPEGLSEVEEDMYRMELETRYADPLEEKARGNFRLAIQMAHKLGVYSEWSQKSGVMAAKLTPQDFPIDREDRVSSDFPKDTLMSTSFVRSLVRGDVEVDFVLFQGESREKLEENGGGGTEDEDVKGEPAPESSKDGK